MGLAFGGADGVDGLEHDGLTVGGRRSIRCMRRSTFKPGLLVPVRLALGWSRSPALTSRASATRAAISADGHGASRSYVACAQRWPGRHIIV
jgi:hypothetical protein